MAPGMVSDIIQGAKVLSKRLVASYVLDWVVLIILGLIARAFSSIDPHFRPFALIDLSISYPYVPESISTVLLSLAAVVVPAILIAGVVVVFVPGPAAWKAMARGEILRIKLWELNVGGLGLALAQVTQLLLVQGIKNLTGKPRPDLLSRCDPDLDRLDRYEVGGFGESISPQWVLISHDICRQKDHNVLVDGFRSFPSGHSATIFAGMLYLSLYFASKFAISFPVVPFYKRGIPARSVGKTVQPSQPDSAAMNSSRALNQQSRQFGYWGEAAAAPTWTLFLVYIPVGVAIYISGTRYFEYYHDGFDIFAGSAIGLFCGWLGFHWYHAPLGRSEGWAWSPRSRDRAFGIGVGSTGYVTEVSGHDVGQPHEQDVELGALNSSGQPQPRTGWERSNYESVRSSVGDERNAFRGQAA